MNLKTCKSNLAKFQGGPVVLRSGREAVKIADELLKEIEEALNALKHGPRPSGATNWENFGFRTGWAISCLERAARLAGNNEITRT